MQDISVLRIYTGRRAREVQKINNERTSELARNVRVHPLRQKVIMLKAELT